MGFMDKLRNRFQMAKGHGEERAGRAMGDPDLEARGAGDRVEGGTKQVGEQVKDVGKNVRDTFGRAKPHRRGPGPPGSGGGGLHSAGGTRRRPGRAGPGRGGRGGRCSWRAG